jgi:ubiquitin-conjugating enzyme (huntingtin interacting protein 2)
LINHNNNINTNRPILDDPQDAVVATQYKSNHKVFVQTARHWANKYAGAPNPVVEYDSKVKQLVDMGFDEVIAYCS